MRSGLGSSRSGREVSSHLAESRRDPDAFATFYDTHADRVLTFFRRRTAHAEVAFDLMSETFAKALERRHQFRGSCVEEERAWLFAIARNELLRFWRDGTIEEAALTRLGIAVPLLTDPEIERIDERASRAEATAIGRELDSLPKQQRRAVEMRIVDEVEYDVLAAALGVSVQTARARVSRGLRALSRSLTPTPSSQILPPRKLGADEPPQR
jgi:RNA polymerase sigma-70 factor (ECF subfamily)